jgi:hypothetical protein
MPGGTPRQEMPGGRGPDRGCEGGTRFKTINPTYSRASGHWTLGLLHQPASHHLTASSRRGIE